MIQYPPGYRKAMKAYALAMFEVEDWHALWDASVMLAIHDAVVAGIPDFPAYSGAGDAPVTASGTFPIGGAYER